MNLTSGIHCRCAAHEGIRGSTNIPNAGTYSQGHAQPSDFDRAAFREMLIKCNEECDVTMLETACFLEQRAGGDIHLNLLAPTFVEHATSTRLKGNVLLL
jgi:hypothetical protein